MKDEIVRLLPQRRGHFLLESGHHGDLWLDLELLFLRPEPVRRFAEQLALRLSRHQVEAVCGPLVEGAFLGLMVASGLGLPFAYSVPYEAPERSALFPVGYRIPGPLRAEVRGRRVAIVNDVINAGSSLRGTLEDLRVCGSRPVVIGALAVLGPTASRLAAENGLALEALCSLPNAIWTPDRCPLCARGVPLSDEQAGIGAAAPPGSRSSG